jgi:hypothetical protein
MAKKFPIHPANPERICWGCDLFCAANAMACANERSPHPQELFGEDWLAWGEQQLGTTGSSTETVAAVDDFSAK